MSFDFVINNLHLLPFEISFFIGVIFLCSAPVNYCIRQKKLILTPRDIFRYNNFERKALIYGAIFVLIGIAGSAFVSEKYGYNITVTDIHGNKRIERFMGFRSNPNTLSIPEK
jgi:hypothetical protein